MTRDNTRFRVHVNERDYVQAEIFVWCYSVAMRGSWKERLKEVVDADGRSLRQISLAAGRGPNFLSQLFSADKDPSISNLASILNVLGTQATLYVMTGIKLDAQSELFLRLALDMNGKDREEVRRMIDELRDAALPPALPASEKN